MKIGLVGGSYQERSIPFDAQRCINLYPVLDEQGKEVSALYGTPGLETFATAGVGSVRQAFAATNDRGFVVSYNTLYEVNSDGTTTSRGTLDTSSGDCSMDENGLELAICDGTYLYIFTYATNTFAKVTDPDLPSCGTVTFIDGYFVVNKNNSGTFYISGLYNGSSWSALDFATAESSPDNLLRVKNVVGQLWLLGSETIEIWSNNGGASFPFDRISGAKLEVGIVGAHTAVAVDNSLFWVGKSRFGGATVYRAQGFSPQRISTSPIEKILQAVTTQSSLKAYSYQQDGHTFYVVTGAELGTTLVYDISTGLWHERAHLHSAGYLEQHLGGCCMYLFNKILVGSRWDGKIYDMRLDLYSDDSQPLVAERIFTHLSNENTRQRFSSLELALESGVGLQSGQGSDPEIELFISKDMGRTWSDGYTASMGKVGKYLTRAIWRRLGIAFNITFKVRITDPVKRALIGAYLK